jgi:hypothetical protein
MWDPQRPHRSNSNFQTLEDKRITRGGGGGNE